jgi:glycosyltransferase involved in cell wall biosynthesis
LTAVTGTTLPRKIAVVHPVEIRPDAIHRDLLPTAYGFQELGHRVTLYGPAASAAIPGLPLVIVPQGLADPEFWEKEAPDWALVLTWLAFTEIVGALKAAGALVIAKADTDGRISTRQHPWANGQRMVLHQRGAVERARAVWHLAKRMGPLHAREVRQWSQSVEAADVVVVESSAAKRALERTFSCEPDAEMSDKIVVRRNPVQSAFSRADLHERRDRLVVAVGRWDDPQKDARLVYLAFARVLARDPSVRIELFGPGVAVFDRLRSTRVKLCGVVPNGELPEVFARAQVIAFGSRWEGGPLAALEALACGCSVVGTRIGAFVEIEAAGGGRTAARRPGALAQAILDELELWEHGERSGAALSNAWRPRVDRRCVAETYVELFTHLAHRKDRIARRA